MKQPPRLSSGFEGAGLQSNDSNDFRSTADWQNLRLRAKLLRCVREFFDSRGFLEVETPILSADTVVDRHLDPFWIEDDTLSRRLWLQTSPEFAMKRLLAAGYPDIFSVCRVYRDGEAGRKHQPEFTMIEWYRLGIGLDEIVTDTTQLIEHALADSAPAADPVQLEYHEAFLDATALCSRSASVDELARAANADDQLRAAIGDEKDDWLDLLLATAVIPRFPTDRLTVLRHYPASQAALARQCPAGCDVADRFEVFLGQVELANGYVELTNAEEQAARMAADNHSRELRGRPVRPIDHDLIAALEAGLPACAGVAMGLERLQMVHDRTDDIRDVITFAIEPDA